MKTNRTSSLRLAAMALSLMAPVFGQAMYPTSLDQTVVGATYSQSFSIMNDICQARTWSVSSGALPPGLSLSVQNPAQIANITGTATAGGTYTFTLLAGLGGCIGAPAQPISTTYTLRVLGLETTSLPDGTAGVPYIANLYATGNLSLVTFGAQGVPGGLTIFENGELSGTPTTPGSYTLHVTAMDNATENSVSGNVTLVINPAPTFSGTTLPAGKVGQSYGPAVIPTTGGTAPLYFEVVSGNLPPGLNLYPGELSQARQLSMGTPQTRSRWLTERLSKGRLAGGQEPGTLSGIPTTPGNYSFTMRVIDAWGAGSTATLTMSIAAAGPAVVTTSLPAGFVGMDYSAALVASGFNGQPAWSVVTGSLPPGLVLESGGTISGVPTAVGSYTFYVMAAGGGQSTPSAQLTIVVNATPFDFKPITVPGGVIGTPYLVTFTPTKVQPNSVFSLQAGNLPPGLTLTSAGVLSGTPTTSGNWVFTVQLVSGFDYAAHIMSIKVETAPLTLTGDPLPEGYLNESYGATLIAGGGRSPYSITVTGGSFPQGIHITPATGLISGVPTQTGVFPFTAQLVDTDGKKLSKAFVLTVRQPLGFGPSVLPDGTQGESYTGSLVGAGGLAPYTFQLMEGALPPGLTLAANGGISGTPATGGNFGFAVRITDANNKILTQSFGIQVYATLTLGPATLPNGLPLSEYSAQLTAAGGLAPYTFTVITGALPDGLTMGPDGLVRGAPTKAGVSTFDVAVTDSRSRRATGHYTVTIGKGPELSLSGIATTGTAGVAYTATFSVTSGTGPYQWSYTGTIPTGLSLDAAKGVLSGTPTVLGKFDFTLRVVDVNGLAATAPFSITIQAGALPPVTVSVGTTTGANDQVNFSLNLGKSYPLPLDGLLTLTFQPDTGFDDPAVLFSNGGRTVTFTVPAGQTTANFPLSRTALQTGTVSGLITLTAKLSLEGQDVTPSPAPAQTLRISPQAPVITRIDATRTSSGVLLSIYGYATPRQVTTANVHFTGVNGVTLAGADFPVTVGTLFTTWYGSTASQPFGSQFLLTLPFTVSNPAALDSATVTLVNGQGTSAPVTARF